MPENILLIMADDLNYHTVGAFGGGVENLTPNLDRLAQEGKRFDNAHVTIGVCQPSRQCLMTGLYPHKNGAPGFDPIREDVPTLQEQLHAAGYLNGIIGKVEHLQPLHKYCWDFCDDVFNAQNLYGRSPYIYYRDSLSFFRQAKQAGKPFFLMANSHDPHRPFAGSEQELQAYGFQTYASRYYRPQEVAVPGFLPDLPEIRLEVAEYCTSVHRLDETVGAVLRALEEEGLRENTLVVFMSDNGMAFPFSKANCYLNSTRTPYIARWPGVIEPGSENRRDFISGIDFMPTVLELLGIRHSLVLDGSSYLPLLRGESQPGRDRVFTQFNKTSACGIYPMRCVQTAQYGYIYNAWSDGHTQYKNESMTGRTWKAMCASADPAVMRRARMFTLRVKEEFYDFGADPDALDNRIGDPALQPVIAGFREMLKEQMSASADPVLKNFLQDMEAMP